MIQVDSKIVEKQILKYEAKCLDYHNDIVSKLENLKNRRSLARDGKVFINNILSEFRNLNFLTVSLDEIQDLVKKLKTVPKIRNKKSTTQFKNELIKIFEYEKRRSDFFPLYFKDLGVKACVYCNSQLTLALNKQNKNKTPELKFQLDHYYSKRKYPYLSIAFFNLYPVCSNCNLAKGEDRVDFNLYSKQPSTNIFRFSLETGSKARYLISRDLNDIIVEFDKINEPTYVDKFNLKEIYSTQNDVAEEIIIKSLIYSETYRKNLSQDFNSLKITDQQINRFILGNYTEPSEINKRPMAKFMQDIGKECGLIS